MSSSSTSTSSSPSSSRPYDIVVFGATGFTGQYIAQYLVEYINKNSIKGIDIAIAARDESRLTALRDRITRKFPTKQLSMLIANTDDATSMRNMTSQTTVLINAVGPFRFYGDAVIEACIATGTHYVDITGEPEFIERMILKHDDAARQAQVFVVPSCGFDSIPSDLGVIYTTQQWQQKFPGIPLPQITSYLTLRSGPQGAALNYGTWASLVQSVAHGKDLAHIRSQLKQKQETEAGKIPRIGPAPKLHSLSWESCVQRWTVKFMGADASVVRQSQQRMTLQDKKEGVTHSYPYYSIYLTISSFFYVFIMGLLSFVGKCVASNEWGRQLMLKHPSWFTLGLLSTSGPTPQQIAEASFEMEMFASDGNNNLHTVVSGPEMGYAATSILVCQSALTVLDEIRNKSKRLARGETGGVMTPAAAFARTDLIDRLQSEKIRFQVVE